MSQHLNNFDRHSAKQVTCSLAQKVLVIGDLTLWKTQGRALPENQNTRFIGFEDLSGKLISEFSPQIIMSPLVSPSFDVFDVAQCLSKMEFHGRYLAVSAALPDAQSVCTEIRETMPSVDLVIVEWPAFRTLIKAA